MTYRYLPLKSLVVNRANDRHGELENETAAIAWLFNNRENHMRNLARDLTKEGQIYEPPLVSPGDGSKFIVFDGNRRIACLKLLDAPRKAPSVEIQKFFKGLREQWPGKFPDKVQCQIEPDRDRLDSILFRRHTGTQNGVGQSTWDDRMKSNFVDRTGKRGEMNVAEEVERRLSTAGMLPKRKKIPWSTMNRLLSAEAFRNRVGISVKKRQFEITHEEPVVLSALFRIADDLAHQRIVLGDLWDVEGKQDYLDSLERDGVLPTAKHRLVKPQKGPKKPTKKHKPPGAPRPTRRTTLIPQTPFPIAWSGRLQKHRAIWEELQFQLHLADHPNAISVLFRVLLELSVENYVGQTTLTTVKDKDTLAKRTLRVAEDLQGKGKIDNKYLGVFRKFQAIEPLVSADTFNRYVHSPNFGASPDHLVVLWDTLADFVVHCLNT